MPLNDAINYLLALLLLALVALLVWRALWWVSGGKTSAVVPPSPDYAKPAVRPLVRWAGVIVFGGLGLFFLVETIVVLIRKPPEDWSGYVFTLAVTALMTLPLGWGAYSCWRQKYRNVVAVFAVVGAVLFYFVLTKLLHESEVMESLMQQQRTQRWLIWIMLPLSILFLIGPFFAAGLFYRFCMRCADRNVAVEKAQT